MKKKASYNALAIKCQNLQARHYKIAQNLYELGYYERAAVFQKLAADAHVMAIRWARIS